MTAAATPDPQCPAERHGPTRWYYNKHGCRCPEAAADRRRYERQMRGYRSEQKATRTATVPDCPSDQSHGSRYAYYVHGCRCPEAVEDLRRSGWKGVQLKRSRPEPSTPDCPSTTGHGTRSAYEHAGCRCPDAVDDMRRRWRDRQRDKGTHRRGAGYDPTTAGDGIVDQIVVERLAQGKDIPATKAERDAAYRLLEQRGLVAREIAERLRLSTRTVVRRRVAA